MLDYDAVRRQQAAALAEGGYSGWRVTVPRAHRVGCRTLIGTEAAT